MTILLTLFLAVTIGWENKELYPEVSLPVEDAIWCASKTIDDFDVECLDGAQGAVDILESGDLRIIKSNDQGVIRVTTRKPVVSAAGQYRVTAHVATTNAIPLATKAYVRLGRRPRRGEIPLQKTLDGRTVGGHQKLEELVNVSAGLRETVCANCESKGGALSTSICVKGGACETIWSGWRVDSFSQLTKAEREAWASARRRNYWNDLIDNNIFANTLANDIDHTASMKKDANGTHFLVDGKEAPLILYKCGRNEPDEKTFAYGGKAMAAAGVKLQVCNIRFGGTPWKEGPWTASGFDAQKAVESIRCAMRTTTNALFVITVRLDAPREFSEAHPDEVWIDANGKTVYGSVVHVSGTEPKRNTWPWMSIHSPAWRSAVRHNLNEFIAELKRTGLSKRVVGIHFGGYHDAQFATACPDCSPCAKAAFAASGETDYVRFLKLAATRLQDELGREVRAAFGKDIVVFRWCMNAFGRGFTGTYDLGAFAASKNIDVIVPQPSYHHRTPGHAISTKLPYSSFLDHGKMLCNELDLRTYAVRPEKDSPIASAGVSRARTSDEWCTINRKLTGQMLARRSGFWYFDMDGGWFERPEILADIQDVVNIAGELVNSPRSSWRPSVALVIDESDFLKNHNLEVKIPEQACDIGVWVDSLAIAGIPCDQYLAADFDNDSSLTRAYRKVFRLTRTSKCPSIDELVREVRDAGGYIPSRPGLQVDMNGDFISVHCLVAGAYEFKLPFPAKVINLKSGKPEVVRKQSLSLDLTAGETCWFRLYKRDVGEVLRASVAAGDVAGVVSVISNPDYSMCIDCAGYADIERKIPMRPDTMFALFSCSKSVCGTAVMILVGEGKLGLDDPVAKYIPEFAEIKVEDKGADGEIRFVPLKRPVTVRDVMSHTSGSRFQPEIIRRSFPLIECARQMAKTPFKFQPGETFSYNNAGIDTGGAVVEIVSGMDFESFCQTRIFQPLGMKDTTFVPNAEQIARLARCYNADGKPFADQAKAGARYAGRPYGDQTILPAPWKVYPAPSAGLYSTPLDFSRYSQMLAHRGEWQGTRIIPEKLFCETYIIKQTADAIESPYTIGNWIRGEWFGHSGAFKSDQRVNIRTGHSRCYFAEIMPPGGAGFERSKDAWNLAVDAIQCAEGATPCLDHSTKRTAGGKVKTGR